MASLNYFCPLPVYGLKRGAVRCVTAWLRGESAAGGFLLVTKLFIGETGDAKTHVSRGCSCVNVRENNLGLLFIAHLI
jgi:hypothetical protein